MPKRDPQLREFYRESNPTCEIVDFWGRVAGKKWTSAATNCDAARDIVDNPWPDNRPQIHHILGGCNRWDLICNMITVCGAAHRWVESDPNAGQIVCWKVKLDKGEFDPAAILEFSRVHPHGWLTLDKVLERCEHDSTLEQWRHELWIAAGGF